MNGAGHRSTHTVAACLPGNRILRALPSQTVARLSPHLRHTTLVHHTPIYASGQPIRRVYFVDCGLISLVQSMRDGHTVEVGAVGVEGLTGSNAIFGIGKAILDTIVQMPGSARTIATEQLIAEAGRCATLSMLLQGSIHIQLAQIAQTAACNRLHSLEQRCCRWLLTAHDSAQGDVFPLTHDFLAMMLGVQRPGVTIAARALQGAGLIRYGRGRVSIMDRAGLEAASCECYGTIRSQIDALFGAAIAPSSN